jgi:hypothetical protein
MHSAGSAFAHAVRLKDDSDRVGKIARRRYLCGSSVQRFCPPYGLFLLLLVFHRTAQAAEKVQRGGAPQTIGGLAEQIVDFACG